MRKQLERSGYRTWARSYPAYRYTIDEAADYLRERIQGELPPGPLVAVTHSLGGIVARRLAHELPWEAMVMLAPPNRGSGLAAAVKARRMLKALAGPAGAQLASPPEWPAPACPFGVIAGTRPGPTEQGHVWLGRRLGVFGPGEQHDGTIKVDETHHPAMTSFATVHAGHNFMMDNPQAHALVLRFLRDKTF